MIYCKNDMCPYPIVLKRTCLGPVESSHGFVAPRADDVIPMNDAGFGRQRAALLLLVVKCDPWLFQLGS